MILYHGSNKQIRTINLAMCRPYKDFGRGFYLTDIEEQARKMADRVTRIYGGDPFVNVYEIDDHFRDLEGYSIMDFGQETSKDWAIFVMNNRSRTFRNHKDLLSNHDNKYDIVIGPVADDDMALLFRQYENELISLNMLLNGLIYKRTSSQYSFHTEKSIALLKKVG